MTAKSSDADISNDQAAEGGRPDSFADSDPVTYAIATLVRRVRVALLEVATRVRNANDPKSQEKATAASGDYEPSDEVLAERIEYVAERLELYAQELQLALDLLERRARGPFSAAEAPAGGGPAPSASWGAAPSAPYPQRPYGPRYYQGAAEGESKAATSLEDARKGMAVVADKLDRARTLIERAEASSR
jgi:hypothetical protein